ncbi:MAG: DNA polymerase III subunit beta [Synergistaceae bacterium]|nr:DNA polymerase III subunit beta [Synergistaceae bacterium]
MKLELERQDFLKAWQTAEKFTSVKTAKDSTRGILITAAEDNSVILKATDLNTSISFKAKGVNVIEPGFAVIPASMFGEMLKKSASEDLVLEVNSERGLLNAGRQKTRFAVIQSEEFPNIPESSGADTLCEIPAPLLATVITEGSSAASQPQDFPKYLGTCLIRTSEGMITGVSTDGKRLSLSKSPCNVFKDEDMLLLAPALRELSKTISGYSEEDILRVLADSSTAWFSVGDIEFSVRRVESTFPKFERILNADVSTTLRINAGDLSSALERIDIIAKTTTAHIMAMALNPGGELRITARAPELGTSSETIQTDIQGGYLQLGFNVGFFLDGLKALGNKQAVIEFSGEEGQTRMKREGSDNFLYMLMPARLTAQDAMTEEEIGDFTQNIEEPQELQQEQQQDSPQEQEQSQPQEYGQDNQNNTEPQF